MSELLDKVNYDFDCADGPDTQWLVLRMHLEEALNRPFDMTLDLVTDDLEVDTSELLGGAIELGISRGDARRSFFGIISEVEFLDIFGSELVVRIRVVPAFALAMQSVNSRIYQEMSVAEVVTEVLDEVLGPYGRSFNPGSISRGQVARDYCVQYRETDYDFVVRLLEEEGISFHFVQDENEGHEVLTFTDANDQFLDAANLDGTPLFPITKRPDAEPRESLQEFDWKLKLLSTESQRQDYTFDTPTEPIHSALGGEADARGRTRRIYKHMRRRYIDGDIEERNTDCIEAASMQHDSIRGKSCATGLSAALLFEPERHAVADLEQKYVLLRVVHIGNAPEALRSTGGGAEGGTRYENHFLCVPESTPVRPTAATPKPLVRGPQTGIVAGPSGEEIHTDEHGRIMVQFHWQEDAAYDDTSSCWIRVAQSWAGPGWGAQFIPRIGMEVVVNFLEGNPDRPLVTGCVYNGDNAFPFALPDSKTQTGWKTNSSPGGGGFNELRFEDASGNEEIFVHAQKDWNTTVLNCRTTTIGADDTLSVGGNRTKTVEGDQEETVNSNKTITIKKDHTETIEGAKTQTVHKDISVTCLANETVSIVKNSDKTITGDHTLTIAKTSKTNVTLKSDEIVGLAKSVKVGGLYSEQVGASRSITAVGAMSFTAGLTAKLQSAKAMTVKAQGKMTTEADDDMAIKSAKKIMMEAGDDFGIAGGKKMTVEAKDQMTLKCGKASITLKKNGDIIIKGKKIQVKGSGDVIVKGSKVKLN